MDKTQTTRSRNKEIKKFIKKNIGIKHKEKLQLWQTAINEYDAALNTAVVQGELHKIIGKEILSITEFMNRYMQHQDELFESFEDYMELVRMLYDSYTESYNNSTCIFEKNSPTKYENETKIQDAMDKAKDGVEAMLKMIDFAFWFVKYKDSNFAPCAIREVLLNDNFKHYYNMGGVRKIIKELIKNKQETHYIDIVNYSELYALIEGKSMKQIYPEFVGNDAWMWKPDMAVA